MKKILFVATVSPFEYGGGSQATRAYLDSVLEIYGLNNVDIILPKEAEIPASYEKLNFLKIPRRSKLKSLLLFLFGVLGRFPIPVTKYLKANIDKYRVCIFNGGKEGGWIAKKMRKENISVVIIHHNQEVEYCLDNKTIYTLGNKWPYTVKNQQKAAYKYSDINLFLTNQDMTSMMNMYGPTVSNNILIGCYDFKDASTVKLSNSKAIYNIVISGTLANYQTVSGILDIYNRYLSIITNIIPRVKILLTGRAPSQEILDIVIKHSNIFSVVSSPIDILTEVQKGSIYLCPTNIGSGLKLRVMDGLKCGLPVLVHSISARGYDYFFNKPYFFVYKDEQSFTNGLNQIMQYLEKEQNSKETIMNDYYNFFGYSNGKVRLQKALSSSPI